VQRGFLSGTDNLTTKGNLHSYWAAYRPKKLYSKTGLMYSGGQAWSLPAESYVKREASPEAVVVPRTSFLEILAITE
jgi:hypothetical protein